MLRNYSYDQAAQKLEIDVAEIRHLVHHFRELLSAGAASYPHPVLSDNDILQLDRLYKQLQQGLDPSAIRASLSSDRGHAMSRPRQAHVLAVVGGRAGVGKSSLILNLASSLNARGLRCTIFDGTDELDGLFESIDPTLPENAWEVTTESGVHLVSGQRLMKSDGELEDTSQRLEAIESSCDYIVVDTGSGGSDAALRYAMAVDETILVTTPDVGANAECFSIIRMLKDIDPDMPIGLVINHASGIDEARESYARINGAAQKLNIGELAGLGWLAENDAMRKYFAEGLAVVEALPTSAAARCISRLADHLVNRLSPVMRRSTGLEGLVIALRNAFERSARSATII